MKFEEINIGDVHEFERTISREDIHKFAMLTGDHSPLHVDVDFGKQSDFQDNIAHGMLVSSLFSTLVGMHCAGEHSVYLGQDLNFKAPVFPDNIVLVRGTVTHKHDSINIIRMKTEIVVDGRVVVDGEARVKVNL
jgi:3-hydroxybutyryl-CoA dehydratase